MKSQRTKSLLVAAVAMALLLSAATTALSQMATPKIIQCAICQHENNWTNKFCFYCSADLTAMKDARLTELQRKYEAKAAPAYRSSFITEIGYSYKINSSSKRENTLQKYVTSELGYIYHLNAKYGLGFTHFTGWKDFDNLHRGLKLRLRKWLNSEISFDLSGGTILWSLDDSELERPVFIGSASLNFSERWALNMMVEVLEKRSYYYSYPYFKSVYSSPRRDVSVYLGCKVGSKPGLVLHGITLASVGVILLYAIFSSFDDDWFNLWGG